MAKRFIILILISIFFVSCTEEDISEYDSELNFSKSVEATDDVDDIDNQSTIFVHITGEILRGGVYEMNKGDRVIDVVDKAGGFTNDANKDYVNLAEKVKDGMKIHIPNLNDKVSIVNNEKINSNKIIDINFASKEELMKLPSVGEKMSESIIKYREEFEFKEFTDLLNVPGIGKKRLEAFKGLISIGGEIYE